MSNSEKDLHSSEQSPVSVSNAGKNLKKPSLESFPKKLRILKHDDFLKIQNQGKKLHCHSFLLFVSKYKEFKIGLTVSKKVDKSSVARNKIKRRLREIVRKNIKNISEPLSLVLIAKAPSKEATYQELEESFIKLLKTAKVWQATNATSESTEEQP